MLLAPGLNDDGNTQGNEGANVLLGIRAVGAEAIVAFAIMRGVLELG